MNYLSSWSLHMNNLFCVHILLFAYSVCSTSIPKLLVISMDGFRYNYLDLVSENEAGNFTFMIKNGVKAKSIMNVFPTVTYPNHFTMITGIYPESHGIVHNRFYDPVWNEYFVYDNKRDNVDPFWYDNGAEPIYVTNKKAGVFRNSGSVLWPCGIGKVKGIGPDRVIPGKDAFSDIKYTDRVDYLISWFTDEKNPINLGLLYFPEPDEIGHATGAGSQNVTDFIKNELNDILGYLFTRLKEVNLFDDMNIILTSDHGMTNYTKDKAIVLSDYLNSTWYKAGSQQFHNHLTVNIFPEHGQKENILQSLHNVTNLFVYKKGESDELNGLHYSNNERIAPIVLTASEGAVIFPDPSARDAYSQIGVHGYNPMLVETVRPFFIAMGPAFKKGYLSEPFNSLDIYPLMCHILDIPAATNNGSFDNVKGLLNERSILDVSGSGIIFIVIIAMSGTIAGIFAICACCHARKSPRLVLHGNNRASGASLRSPTHHLLNSEDDDDEF